jgi:peptidyl-prolyl cis-trans isomerase SurA
MKKIWILICSLISLAAAAQPHKVVADKIIGIVGDRIILRSDVFNQIADIKRQGGEVPEDAQCILMEQVLVRKVLSLQAAKDSLPVSEDEIEAELDQRIRYFIGQLGSKEELERVAGKTVYQIKDDSRDFIRENKMAEAMQRKIVEGAKITPNEVKAYYDRIPVDSLAFYESELEIGEIVAYPKANREIEKYTIEELNEFKKQVEAGTEKFETLVSLYSKDPGSKDKGGEYLLNRNEKTWDPAFMSNAFKLKEGQISPVFKSKFGYHIIQMMSRNGDEATVRHILRIPQVTDGEINGAILKLDSIQAKLANGSIKFGDAVAKYSDDDAAKFTGGFKNGPDGSPYISIDKLDKGIVLLLKDLQPGQFSAPTPFVDERERRGVRIVYLKSRSEPHRENLRDDYSRVAQRALEEKKLEMLDKWFMKNIPNYYIMIDPELQNCKQMERWMQPSQQADKKF